MSKYVNTAGFQASAGKLVHRFPELTHTRVAAQPVRVREIVVNLSCILSSGATGFADVAARQLDPAVPRRDVSADALKQPGRVHAPLVIRRFRCARLWAPSPTPCDTSGSRIELDGLARQPTRQHRPTDIGPQRHA